MAERTLVENVAQVKADFKAVKDAVPYVFNDNPPTSEYGERIFTEISSLQYQADSAWDQGFNNGIEQGRVEGLEQGIEQGKQDVISKSKYIPKTASGKVIRLDDVSEVYHNVRVKADTPTEVKVYGANIISDDVYDATKWILYSANNYRYQLFFPEGVYTISAKSTVNETYLYLQESTDNTTFTVINKLLYSGKSYGTCTFTIEKNKSYYLWSSATKYFANISEVQLEVGSNATEYEPYKGQTITATPTGTETHSICPTMTFLADSDVTVDYFGSYGMQTEYDGFWDRFQQNGSKTNYNYAFYGTNWNDAIFKPKYDIIATNLTQGFYDTEITNLVDRLEEQGVRFDVSGCKSLGYAFGHSALTVLPKLDMSSCTNSDSMCVGCYYLTRCEGIVSSDITKFHTGTFQNCSALEHIIFEGTIASNITLQWSKKLDIESLISLFRCLKFFASDDTNYMTKTITLSAESWALTETQEFMDEFEGQYGKMYAYFFGWNVA